MPSSPPTLRDMIQTALDGGRTYEQLAAAAVDERTGKRMSRAQINNVVTGKVDRLPYDYHLRALAAALKKPYESVRQAAIRQWLPAEDSDADAAALLERASRLAAESDRLSREAARLAEIAGRPTSTGENGHRESA